MKSFSVGSSQELSSEIAFDSKKNSWSVFMKRFIFTIFLLPLFLLSAAERVVDLRDVEEFCICVDDQEPVDKNTLEGDLEDLIIEVKAGTFLPLDLFLKGDFFKISGDAGSAVTLEITQTFFVKIRSDELLLSSDQEDWTSFEDFFTGELFLGVQKDEQEDLTLTVGLEANQRS